MNTNTQEQPEESTEDFAKHSSVGMLVERIDKAIKRNPAMPVGELWQWHLKALVMELHRFHIDYADDAAAEAAEEGGGPDAEYVEALVDLAVEAKEGWLATVALLMEAYKQQGFLNEEGVPAVEKMPVEKQENFKLLQLKLNAWLEKYPELIEEPVPALPPAPEKAV